MNRIVVVACVLLFAPPVLAQTATLLASEDFEEGDAGSWWDSFDGDDPRTPGENMALTTSNSLGGYSLRFNQWDYRPSGTDPITELPVSIDPQHVYWHGALSAAALDVQAPTALYIRFSFRHDIYTNLGTNLNSKMGYMHWRGHGVFQGPYWSWQGVVNPMKLSYQNGNFPTDEQWARDNWGYTSLNVSFAGVSHGADGQWHTFEVYNNFDEDYIQVWIDGVVGIPYHSTYLGLYPSEAAAGKLQLNPSENFRLRGMTFPYWSYGTGLTDGPSGDYAAGMQVDNFEMWNGVPGEEIPRCSDGSLPDPVTGCDEATEALTEPSNLTATGGN